MIVSEKTTYIFCGTVFTAIAQAVSNTCEGLKKIKLIAAEYGLSASELKNLSVVKARKVKRKTVKKRGPVAPKYRDPSNSTNTWTGGPRVSTV